MRWPTTWMPAVALILFAAPLATTSAAEVGAIVGLITTQAGAPVPHATVTALRADGGAIRATIAGSDGVYSFADVTPGSWSVTAEAPGAPSVSAPTLLVVAGKSTRSDLV